MSLVDCRHYFFYSYFMKHKIETISCCICGTDIHNTTGKKHIKDIGFDPHPVEREIIEDIFTGKFKYQRCCESCYQYLVLPNIDSLNERN